MTPKTPEETVAALEARLASIKDETATKKARLREIEQERAREIKLRLRRARYRVASKERKRRTRRLILIGTYVESKTKDNPEASARLLQGLDGFLAKPRDRELFDLDPLPEDEE